MSDEDRVLCSQVVWSGEWPIGGFQRQKLYGYARKRTEFIVPASLPAGELLDAIEKHMDGDHTVLMLTLLGPEMASEAAAHAALESGE